MRRLLPILAAMLTASAALPATFTVDAGSMGKRVYPLNGVIAGPGHMTDLPGRTFTERYQDMGIPLVRAHDYYGPCDLSTIFPSAASGWTEDPDDLGNHDFTETDAVISEIEEAGCDILFRFGESWYNDNPHNDIPPDFSKVAAVCEQIVAHYGGPRRASSEYGIKLWEIWNEPNHDMFWSEEDEDCEQFIEMFVTIAKRLLAKWPRIKLGGPGAKGDTTDGQVDFARRLALRCRLAGVPLHFYSWHYFNGTRKGPYVFAEHAQAIRETLDEPRLGMKSTLNVLGGWSTAPLNPGAEVVDEEDAYWKAMFGDINGAAYSAAVLTYLHLYTDVRYACRYRGDYWEPADGYGMITERGRPKKPGYAFKAYSGLFPQRDRRKMHLLSCEGGDTGNEGEDGQCRAIMATMDEGRQVVNVLISLWEHGTEGFALTVSNLPDGWSEPMMEYYVVSASRNCERERQRSISREYGQFRRHSMTVGQVPDTTSSVHLIRLYDATKFPVFVPGEAQLVEPVAKPPLYIVSMMHAEDLGFFMNDEEAFGRHAQSLRALTETFAQHGAKLAFQPDWTFIEGAKKWDPDLFTWLLSQGMGVDAHTHGTQYSLEEVAEMLRECGVPEVRVGNGDFNKPRPPLANMFWAFSQPWGDTGEPHFEAICAYKDAATQASDRAGIAWRPAPWGNWHRHDPDAPVVYIGGGPLGVLEDNFRVLGTALAIARQNLRPGCINVLYWHDSLHRYGQPAAAQQRIEKWQFELRDTFDQLAAAGVVKWATFSEILDAYLALEGTQAFALEEGDVIEQLPDVRQITPG